MSLKTKSANDLPEVDVLSSVGARRKTQDPSPNERKPEVASGECRQLTDEELRVLSAAHARGKDEMQKHRWSCAKDDGKYWKQKKVSKKGA
jgi:hypothetical protein